MNLIFSVLNQIDQLNGRNDELRSELKKSRSEVSDLVVQMERKKKQVGAMFDFCCLKSVDKTGSVRHGIDTIAKKEDWNYTA